MGGRGNGVMLGSCAPAVPIPMGLPYPTSDLWRENAYKTLDARFFIGFSVTTAFFLQSDTKNIFRVLYLSSPTGTKHYHLSNIWNENIQREEVLMITESGSSMRRGPQRRSVTSSAIVTLYRPGEPRSMQTELTREPGCCT